MDYLLKGRGADQPQEQLYAASGMCTGLFAAEKELHCGLLSGRCSAFFRAADSYFPQLEDVKSVFQCSSSPLGIAVFVSRFPSIKDEYKILKQEPLYFDHDYLQEPKGEHDGLQKNSKRLIKRTAALIFLSCIIAIISEDVLHMEEGLLDAVYLLLISTAVFLFIYAGCSMDTHMNCFHDN